jgi:hypothetical protein
VAPDADSEYDEGSLMRNTQTIHSPLRALLLASLTLALAATLPAVDTHPQTSESHESVLAAALGFSPEYTTAIVGDRGEPVTLFADLNADGRTDVAVLTIAADSGVAPRAAELSDTKRLYAHGATEPLFILEIYLAGQDAILTMELGRRAVWSGLELVPLGDAGIAIEVRFRSRGGSNSELAVFHRGRLSRLSLENTRNERGFLIDVDEDGVTDVLTARRVPEAGRGYETFLTLHTLQTGGFRQSDSLPLVRTVSDFLRAATEEMESGSWDELRRRVAGDRNGVLAAAFTGVADEDIMAATRFDYDEREEPIVQVVFPRLADNPFPPPYVGESFRVVFRVECCDHPPRFFESTIGLDRNPFGGTAVAFLTDDGDGR